MKKGEMPPIKTFPRKQNKQMVSFMRRNLFSCPMLRARELTNHLAVVVGYSALIQRILAAIGRSYVERK